MGQRPRKRAAANVRRRRAPEEARAEILDAAERVFARVGPDAAGLKAVADEAGVSHGLVTHYFGTYQGLVRAALSRRFRAAREEALRRIPGNDEQPDPASVLGVLFDALKDPVHARLVIWGIFAQNLPPDAMPFEEGSLRPLVEALAENDARRKHERVSAALVHEKELLMLVALSAAYGFALGKRAFFAALGRPPTLEDDAEFEEMLARLLVMYHLQGARS